MTILKALFWDSEGDGNVIADVVQHEGRMWLVGKWLQNLDERWMQPARIVRPLWVGAWQTGAPAVAEFLIVGAIPKSVFEEGAPTPEGQFEVVDRPAIRIQVGGVQ